MTFRETIRGTRLRAGQMHRGRTHAAERGGVLVPEHPTKAYNYPGQKYQEKPGAG